MLALAKALLQTPHSAFRGRQRKVRRLVADTDGIGPHTQGLGSGAYLASKQDIGLLDASSCDQLFGELGKRSCERDGRPRVRTVFAHVSCSLAISHSIRPAAYAGYVEGTILNCQPSFAATKSASGHVWTAPALQEKSDVRLAVGCKSCVRPVCAVSDRWP